MCPKLYAPSGISIKWTYLPPRSTTNSHSLCHRSQTPRHGQCTHSAFPGRTWTHTPFHLQPSWESGGKAAGLPLQQDNPDCPRVAQHALVLGSSGNVQSDPTVSAQHTQPGVPAIQPGSSQSNLNLHAGLLEPQQSKSRASLRQWQHELRLLKEDQPDLSMRPSEPFLTRWKAIADFLLHLFQDKKLQPGTIDGYKSAIADNWAIAPLMSARMRISLVSWTVP